MIHNTIFNQFLKLVWRIVILMNYVILIVYGCLNV